MVHLRNRDVKFLVQVVDQGFQPVALLFQGFTTGDMEVNSKQP